MSNAENQDVVLPGIKVSGQGTATPSTKEEIEIIKENENQQQENPMDKIVEESELPADIVKAAETLRKTGERIVEVKTKDAKEFKGNSIDDIVVEEQKEPILSQSEKKEFNPNLVTDPRKATNDDGGVSVNRTRGPVDDGAVEENKTTGRSGIDGVSQNDTTDMNTDSIKDKYELTGFSVQYNTKEGMVAVDVREYYDNMDDAMNSISEFIYIMKDGVKADITRGAPIICLNEIQKKEYLNEGWRQL